MITANLTVFREANGTLHLPNGSLLPVLLTCEPTGSYSLPAYLETVVLKHVSSALVVQSAWSTGCFVATKVTNACTGTYVYVAEPYNDVYGLQNPCCATGSSTVVTPPHEYECPTVTISSTGAGNVHAAFTAKGSTSYIVHLYSNADGSTEITQATFTNGSGSPVSATHNFNSLAPGTYYVEVRETGSTTPCTIQQYILAAPTATCPVITFTPHIDGFDYSWTSDAVADQYRVRIFSDAGGTTQIGSDLVLTGATPGTPELYGWAKTGLTAGTQYWFRLSPMLDGTVLSECTLQAATTSAAPSVFYYDFFNSQPVDLEGTSLSQSMAHTPETNIVINPAGTGANKWFLGKYNATESAFATWFNTSLNNGAIPDSTFSNIVVIGAYKYIKSRVAFTLDESQLLTFGR